MSFIRTLNHRLVMEANITRMVLLSAIIAAKSVNGDVFIQFAGMRSSVEGMSFVSRGADTLVRKVKPDIKLPVIDKPIGLAGLRANSATLGYVAIGGKLSAGYRDEGLYREGQLTAFPNLLAHQMGLSTFTSPLFEPSQGNGTGYSVMINTSPYPYWKRVENNRALLPGNPLRLAKHIGPIPDNLAFPEGPAFVASMPDNYMVIYPGQRDFMSHLNRVLSDDEQSRIALLDLVDKKAPDFCTFETHIDEFVGLAERPINLTTNFLFSHLDEAVVDQQIVRLKQRGIRLVLFTVPQVLDLPYFHLFSVKALLTKKPAVYVRYKNNHINPIVADETTLLLPTESVRRTFMDQSTQGLLSTNPFADEEVISADEVREFRAGLTAYNDYYIRRAGKRYNIPVVDLEKLYKLVQSDQYVSEDGRLVKGTFPEGEFFSSDGRYPSAIGQAVITNEVIKTINRHYQTTIPLIDLGKFGEALRR